MQVCTYEKCQLGLSNCYFARYKNLRPPQHDQFETEQVATLFHVATELHDFAAKYKRVWMRQTPGKTLEAHQRLEDLMLGIMNKWWQGMDFWSSVLHNESRSALTVADLQKCLTLPKGIMVPFDMEDVFQFRETCKVFFGACFEATKNDRFKVLKDAF